MATAAHFGRLGAPAAVLACACWFALPAFAAGADPDRAAAAVITCPAGPAGWPLGGNGWATSGGGVNGRFVLTPRSPVGEGQLYGGKQAQVECNYQATGRRGDRIVVLVRYALTRSFNPYADFYIGCKTKGSVATMSKPWDRVDRTYRVVSDNSWSYATFIDSFAVLESNDVAAFSAIARTLLGRAEPVAHDCKLAREETGLQELWQFGFDAKVKSNGLTTSGGTSGSLLTRPNQRGGTGRLGQIDAKPIVLTIRKGSRLVGKVTLRVTRPLSFKQSYAHELRAAVKVTTTTYAPCTKGATGTLMISTEVHAARLNVCGRNVIRGTGPTGARIFQ